MKKVICLLIAALLLIPALTSCSKKERAQVLVFVSYGTDEQDQLTAEELQKYLNSAEFREKIGCSGKPFSVTPRKSNLKLWDITCAQKTGASETLSAAVQILPDSIKEQYPGVKIVQMSGVEEQQ
ncbi:MAG: hypothetical protein J5585_06295 [Clostridia bacterium]|nr:hypothetical protein [Clostridia bacterium]